MAHQTTGNRHPSDRFTGALLALACGDALGAPAEFMSRTQMRSAFGICATWSAAVVSDGLGASGPTTPL